MKNVTNPLFVLLLLGVLQSSYAIDHWESLVLPGDAWRYFIGVSEPPSNWMATEFNQESWKTGAGG
ncbi:MAG: hypothetical protein EHM72_08635, partial [Calditrichaeota bacterium]